MTDPTPAKLGLAAMRQSGHLQLPRRSTSICLAGQVLSKIRSVTVELTDIEQQIRLERAAEISEQPAAAPGPERLGGRAAPPITADADPEREPTELDRAAEAKRAELRALGEVLDQHTGVLEVQGIAPREWRKLCDENPPRDDNRRDAAVGRGYINAEVLLTRLGDFAVTWNGEDLGPGDWELIEATAVPADLDEVALLVVSMHEVAVNLGKLRSDLRATQSAASR